MVKSKTIIFVAKILFITSIAIVYFNTAFAQERILQGVVFDNETKFRLNKVKILNKSTSAIIYNNSKGEFEIGAKIGDEIICLLEGYHPDTTKITSKTSSLVIVLRRKSIILPQVTVKDSTLTAQQKYEELKKQFNTLHRLGNNQDLFSIGSGGVGLSIDALWSAFSKEGRNARKLMDIMQKDYQGNIIDARFNASIVQKVTGLKEYNLYVFLQRFKPNFYLAAKATDYEMLQYIKLAYNKFKKSVYFRNEDSPTFP